MTEPSESTTQSNHTPTQVLVDNGNVGFVPAAVFGRYENDTATNGAVMSELQPPMQAPQMMLDPHQHQQQIQNQQQHQLFLQQSLVSPPNFLQQSNMAAAFGQFGFHNPFAFGALNPMMFTNAGTMSVASGGGTNIAAAPRSDNLQDEAAHVANDAYQRGRQDTIMHLVRAGAGMASFAGIPTMPGFPGMVNPRVKGPPGIQNEEFLVSLGSNCLERRTKNVPYFDASTMADPDPVSVANRRTRGGVTEPFPEKLHRMIREAEKNGKPDVLSFFPHGRSFAIHKPERFCAEIMSKYFKQSRLSSFQRQLNLCKFFSWTFMLIVGSVMECSHRYLHSTPLSLNRWFYPYQFWP